MINAAELRHGDVPVLDLQKNARERLRITHTTFKGRPYIDLRVWFVDEAGDYQPSRSGVSIRPEHLAEVMRGLALAGRELSTRGA
ncbi:transcriptional coactivator p15/PC4 family protein [Paraburkholderia sediminicola]|uniref:transcriptional coactivator p15/PC4 family protein n=1 Tax=Paraburkholderia sediminicola TaxID=458836 RepID=UPI0038BC25CD